MAAHPDFDMQALYDALDARRLERGLSWSGVALEVNRLRTMRSAIATSTITRLRQQPVAEGDGILQMLLWLRRTPESFVPDVADSDSARYRLPELTTSQILRWDTRALFIALDVQRRERRLTWSDVARDLSGFTPGMLTNLSKGGRTSFPRVMRLVRWLDRPAVTFTRIAYW